MTSGYLLRCVILFGIWSFLTSPSFAVLAGLATIVPFLYAISKYLIKPIRVYYNEQSLTQLRHERAYLRRVIGEIDRLDRATYWEDLLYTPLEVEVSPFQLIPPEFMVLKRSEGTVQSRKKRFSMNLDLSDEGQERYSNIVRIFKKYKEPLIILGDPGAGKSVSFRHAIREIVNTQTRWFRTKPLIPLYIPCSHYTESSNGSPLPVADFLRQYVGRILDALGSQPLAFDQYLEEGRLVLFFDALDEMPRRDYTERIFLLKEFAIEHSQNHIFFSCRRLDYDNRLQVREVSIRPFDRKRRQRFLKKGLSRKFNRAMVRALIYRLETDSRLSELLSNPFFCQLVVFYLIAVETLPTNRYQLFSLYIERRLAAENSRWANLTVNANSIISDLSSLAYQMSESKGLGTSLEYDDALSLLQREAIATDAAKETLSVGVQTKLLLLSAEHNRVQFTHHRLQEYFAALHATEQIRWNCDAVGQFADDPWWREVLIMMMGIGEQQSEKIRTIIECTLNDCLNSLLGIIEACDMVIEETHRKHKLDDVRDSWFKQQYIANYLYVFDPYVDDDVLLQNILDIEQVYDSLPVPPEESRDGLAARAGLAILGKIAPAVVSLFAEKSRRSEPYHLTVEALANDLRERRESLRRVRRGAINRIALSLACATNSGLSSTSHTWSVLRRMALTILRSGTPLEQVKIVKELMVQDTDDEVKKEVRLLLSGESRWVRREIFSFLLDFRIPHVGFDRRSLLYMWREFDYWGLIGTMREYSPQLMKSFVRVKSITILTLFAILHTTQIILFSSALPWFVYRLTNLEFMGAEYVIDENLVIFLCLSSVAIATSMDILEIRFIRGISVFYGAAFAAFILVFSYGNSDAKPPDRPPARPNKVFLFTIAGSLGIYLAIKAIEFFRRVTRYAIQIVRSYRLRRSLKGISPRTRDHISIDQLLTFYESLESAKAKAMTIRLLEQTAEFDEALLTKLTELAFQEKNGSLADSLWHLIYELEKRQLRVASAL